MLALDFAMVRRKKAMMTKPTQMNQLSSHLCQSIRRFDQLLAVGDFFRKLPFWQQQAGANDISTLWARFLKKRDYVIKLKLPEPVSGTMGVLTTFYYKHLLFTNAKKFNRKGTEKIKRGCSV